MKRKRRTEILIHSIHHLSAQFAQQIEQAYEVIMVEEPNGGLVMVKTRECAQNTLFYMGEVFVTECKVQIKEAVGIGLVVGHDETLAYQLAVIDAAYQAQLPETEQWYDQLLTEEQAIKQQRANELAQIMRTKVNFETMDVE